VEKDNEDSEGEEEEEKVEEQQQPTRSVVYQEFLQYLQLGCAGQPLQGYPAVIIVLSTIPPSVSSYFPFPTLIQGVVLNSDVVMLR